MFRRRPAARESAYADGDCRRLAATVPRTMPPPGRPRLAGQTGRRAGGRHPGAETVMNAGHLLPYRRALPQEDVFARRMPSGG